MKEIDFSSAKKPKTILDKAMYNATTMQQLKHNKSFQIAMPGREKEDIVGPSENEQMSFYRTLDSVDEKPVALSLVDPFADSFSLKGRLTPTMHDLFNQDDVALEYNQLIRLCSETNSNRYRSQSNVNAFFRHRAGRIGASASKQASHTNPLQPSQYLIKSICYPDLFKFQSVAMDYGCKHEQNASTAFDEKRKHSHLNFRVMKNGMFIHKDFP